MNRQGWIGLWAFAAILWTLVFFPRNTSSTEIEIRTHTSECTTSSPASVNKDSQDSISVQIRKENSPGDKVPKRIEKSESTTPGGCINVNTASSQRLQCLAGIGPVLAQRIIAWREGKGKFSQPRDLIEVKGIGPVTVEKNRHRICF